MRRTGQNRRRTGQRSENGGDIHHGEHGEHGVDCKLIQKLTNFNLLPNLNFYSVLFDSFAPAHLALRANLRLLFLKSSQPFRLCSPWLNHSADLGIPRAWRVLPSRFTNQTLARPLCSIHLGQVFPEALPEVFPLAFLLRLFLRG